MGNKMDYVMLDDKTEENLRTRPATSLSQQQQTADNIVDDVQDKFLHQLKKSKIAVSIYLVNGIQLKGRVELFDHDMIVLRSDLTQVVVYKHAISTVMPSLDNVPPGMQLDNRQKKAKK